MSDLIDREAVREFIKSYRHSTDVAFHMEDHLDEIPSASPWHRVEEPPKKTGKYAVCWTYQGKNYWDWLIFLDGDWQLRTGLPLPAYWMPIELPMGTERSET